MQDAHIQGGLQLLRRGLHWWKGTALFPPRGLSEHSHICPEPHALPAQLSPAHGGTSPACADVIVLGKASGLPFQHFKRSSVA